MNGAGSRRLGHGAATVPPYGHPTDAVPPFASAAARRGLGHLPRERGAQETLRDRTCQFYGKTGNLVGRGWGEVSMAPQ